MGMRKTQVSEKNGSTASGAWKQKCADLQKQTNQLRRELTKLQRERRAYGRVMSALVFEELPPDLDWNALLAEAARQPPLEELIAELERSEVQ